MAKNVPIDISKWSDAMKRLNPELVYGRVPATAMPKEGAKIIRQRKAMNKTEEAAFAYLSGFYPNDIVEREGLKLAVGNNSYFIPDFTIDREDGIICFEVKGSGGHIEDDAVVKIKAAATRWARHHQFFLIWPTDRYCRDWNIQKVLP